MRSVLDVKLAEPTILLRPPEVASHAAALEAIELADAYGLGLDPDQAVTLHAALGERSDGSWAAGEVGDFKGRQAGKNDSLKARVLAGVELFGEKLIIHTAHEFPTAREDFLRFVGVLDSSDDLRSKVKRITYGHGEEGVTWLNGARLLYKARTSGSGRGFAEADLVIYDEAQHLKAEHLAASLPTMLVNPNFQAWFCGSGGFESSSHAWGLRKRAVLAGVKHPGRLAYSENTAQTWKLRGDVVDWFGVDPDRMLDHDVLSTHPGYANGRVGREAFETMYLAMGPDLFGREFLCIWEPELGDGGESPIDPTAWALCADLDSQPPPVMQWALVVSPDRKWATFGSAGRRPDGRVHVEVLVPPDGVKPGVGWIVAGAKALAPKFTAPLRIHRTGPEAAYLAPLKEAGVDVVEVSSAEAAQATGQFIDFANTRQLAHRGQPQLDVALRGAVLRESSDGAVVWSQRNSQTEISPLLACTVALGGVPQETGPTWLFA